MTYLRNLIINFLYKNFLKRLFFKRDPEEVHDQMIKVGILLGKFTLTRLITRIFFNYQNQKYLQQTISGITFQNPVGLSAGFDKNAQLLDILPDVGFGFEEIGSITGEYCEGNPKPRLWRLKESKSLLVYYGLKNDGSETISRKLSGKNFRFPVGISIAKTNSDKTVEEIDGINDYLKAYRNFLNIGDYITINISCPNAFGGQPFTDSVKLEHLLIETDKLNDKRPVFLKLNPDLDDMTLNKLLDVSLVHKVDGYVISNLTKDRNNKYIVDKNIPEVGGMSGKVVQNLSDEMIKKVYKYTKGDKIIMGSGGIFTAEDAYKKIKNGASLLQIITGMIYNGPQVVSEINLGLVKLLKHDGYKNISEAIGKDI